MTINILVVEGMKSTSPSTPPVIPMKRDFFSINKLTPLTKQMSLLIECWATGAGAVSI